MENFRILYKEKILTMSEADDFIIFNRRESDLKTLLGLSSASFAIWENNPECLSLLVTREEIDDILRETIANKNNSQSVA